MKAIIMGKCQKCGEDAQLAEDGSAARHKKQDGELCNPNRITTSKRGGSKPGKRAAHRLRCSVQTFSDYLKVAFDRALDRCQPGDSPPYQITPLLFRAVVVWATLSAEGRPCNVRDIDLAVTADYDGSLRVDLKIPAVFDGEELLW